MEGLLSTGPTPSSIYTTTDGKRALAGLTGVISSEALSEASPGITGVHSPVGPWGQRWWKLGTWGEGSRGMVKEGTGWKMMEDKYLGHCGERDKG